MARRARPQSLVPNPPWVSALLAKSMVTLQAQVPPAWMPKFEETHKGRGTAIDVELAEYGTGAYGTVMPTLDPAVVMKVTSDPSEAKFATEIADTLPTSCVTQYHMAVQLEGQARHGRPVFLLWRESAEHVGKIDELVGQKAEDAINAQHQAAQRAYMAAAADKVHDYVELVRKWRDAALKMSRIPELEFVAIGMVRAWDEQGIFISDVHGGNLGMCRRNGQLTWVITDPGNVVLSRDPAEERSERQRERASANPATVRVLHIEDEPAIADGVRRALKDADVTNVDTIDGAITRLREGETFDLLISDYDLKDDTADTLMRWIDKHRPELRRRMFFVSGNDAAQAFGLPVLEKPVSAKAIKAMVAQMLATPNPRPNPDVDPWAMARIVRILVVRPRRVSFNAIANGFFGKAEGLLTTTTARPQNYKHVLRSHLNWLEAHGIVHTPNPNEAIGFWALSDKALAYLDRGNATWPVSFRGSTQGAREDLLKIERLFATDELARYVKSFMPYDGEGWRFDVLEMEADRRVRLEIFHETRTDVRTRVYVHLRRDAAWPSITIEQVEITDVPDGNQEFTVHHVDQGALSDRGFPDAPQVFLAMVLPYLVTYAP